MIMRSRLKNNSEVAHYWANRIQPSGNCPSMRFEGDLIYSYALPIGKLVSGGRALIRRNYKTITTQRHISEVRNSIPYNQHCYVHSVGDRYGVLNHHWIVTEANAISEDFRNTMMSFHRARKDINKECHYSGCQKIIENTRILIDILSTLELNVAPLTLALDELQTLIADLATNAGEFVERQKQLESERKARLKEQELERIKRWKAFDTEIGNSLYGINKTYLRLLECGDVHTSCNVIINNAEARLACKLFKSGRLLGTKLAGFTITQVDSVKKVVIAGCHTVPFSEIDEICNKLEEV